MSGRFGRMALDQNINYEKAQRMAAKYGAKKFRGGPDSHTFEAWSDRILWLPRAAERGEKELKSAVEEANRYA